MAPVCRTLFELGQRALIAVVALRQFAHNRCLSARVLAQDLLVIAGDERCHLRPVQTDELFRDLGGGEIQFSPTVVTLDEAQISDGMEQRELVTGDEAALVQKALKRTEERELLFGSRRSLARSLVPIRGALGHDPADAASWIRHIPIEPGDEMHVCMRPPSDRQPVLSLSPTLKPSGLNS